MNNHVQNHSYLFRCIPIEMPLQHIVECQFTMEPNQFPNRSVDAFGNHVLSGYISQAHCFLDFSVRGITERDNSKEKTDWMPCYCYPSPMTKPDDSLWEFYRLCKNETAGIDDVRTIAARWMHLLSERMQYVKDSTNVETTAAKAFAAGQCVCQDYTHIFLTLLRMK
ncbi:MAG: hypothetical protein LUC50_06190 [Ruminococcus sp.]|nr:hypothetical protein [Ruminococcus sp.]